VLLASFIRLYKQEERGRRQDKVQSQSLLPQISNLPLSLSLSLLYAIYFCTDSSFVCDVNVVVLYMLVLFRIIYEDPIETVDLSVEFTE